MGWGERISAQMKTIHKGEQVAPSSQSNVLLPYHAEPCCGLLSCTIFRCQAAVLLLFQNQAFLGLFNQIVGKLSSSHLSLAFTSKAFWKIICPSFIGTGISYHRAATKEWASDLCFLSDTGYRLPHYFYFLRKWKNSIHSSSCWKIMHEFIMSSALNQAVLISWL